MGLEDTTNKKFLGIMKEETLGYPEPKKTGAYIRDGLYNWVVKRYKKNHHEWKTSDERIFHTVIYFFGDHQ